MDYRLLYDAGNGYEDLDLGDEAPAMNYQIANLNELKDRQAAYSQRIKLPKTDKNLRLLGFLDSLAVVADAAYTPGRCKLLCEGAEISPAGAVLYVDGIDDYAGGSIDCQIVSSTVDLFSILGDVENDQMGNDIWKSIWTSKQIVEDNAEEGGAKRWPAVFSQLGQTSGSLFPLEGVQIYRLVPCYRFVTMIEELFRLYGYRLDSDLLNDPYMQSLYITASKITEDSDVSARFSGKTTTIPMFGGSSGQWSGNVDLERVYQVETLGGSKRLTSASKWDSWVYYAAQPGDYKLVIDIMNIGIRNLDDLRKLQVVAQMTRGVEAGNKLTTTILEEYNPTIVRLQIWHLEVDAPGLQTGDYITFEVRYFGGGDINNYTTIGTTARVSLVHEDSVPGIGSTFDFARATGFKSYKELVQAFMQLFGAVVEVVPSSSGDGMGGTVRMNTFQDLYSRRDAGRYVDWSRKLVIDNERSIGFTVGNYAQNNVIQLTDNPDDGTHDAGSFKIENRTLQSEKNLFTIAVEAGRDLTSGSKTAAVVPTIDPMIETDDNGEETMTPTYKGCKAHLLRIDESRLYSTQIATGFYTYNRPYYDFPQALTVPMQELVDRYYQPVKGLMTNTRTISAYFNLTALDIAQLDLFSPVWIERYGCFFYISKIHNFIAGQPTKVELVKLSNYKDTVKYYITLNGGEEDIAKTAPVSATEIRVPYSTNGRLQIATSGNAIASVTPRPGYLVIDISRNYTFESRVGTVTLSVAEDPTVVRTITVTQEAMPAPAELQINLFTDGTDLYVSTSRPLAAGEEIMVLTRGAGRCIDRLGMYGATDSHHYSRRRWHIPINGSPTRLLFPVDESGKINLHNRYKWRLDSGRNGDPNNYCHIDKANWSRGFGYKAVEGLDKAVTFAVAVCKYSKEVSNRCYFESRCHIRNGALTQEFVTAE